MYRVLIVEDEMLVRLGLKNSIDWAKFNMTVVSDVADGLSAWNFYLKEKPDLIITDLKMPIMGGMELITRIRENDKKTRIIILSCMEEFDIVRKAMFYGVSDYILKLTMTEEEIETILEKARNELNKQGNLDQTKHTDNINKDVIKEKFFKDYLFYNIYSQNEFTKYVSEAKLRLSPGNLVMCIMQIDHFKILKDKFNDEKGQLIKYAILNMLDELLVSFKRGEAFSDNDLNYILIFSFSEILSEQNIFKELHLILNNIMSTISSYLNVHVSFGISSLNNGYKMLGKMYREASVALEQKFFKGTGLFFHNDPMDFDDKVLEKVSSISHQSKLLKILGDSGKRDYNFKIDHFLKNGSKSKDQLQIFFTGLIQWLASILYAIDDNFSVLVRIYSEKIYKCETLDDVIEAFNGYISEITDEVVKKKVLSKEVAESLQYIQLNYGHDINLTQVAAHVGLSPNYLGNLFKKELQVNFIEYLNELRIAKAKELLLGTYLKSYEIAEKVGFTENTYFSKVFKKITGASPNEFRKQLMKEWSEEMENEDQGTV